MYLGLVFFADISFYIRNTSLHTLRLTYPSTFRTSSPASCKINVNWAETGCLLCTCLGLNWQLSTANISNPTHTAYILLSYSWIYMSLCQIKHYEDVRTIGGLDLPPHLMEVSDHRHGSNGLPPTIELVYPLKSRFVESMCQSGFCDPYQESKPKIALPRQYPSHYSELAITVNCTGLRYL